MNNIHACNTTSSHQWAVKKLSQYTYFWFRTRSHHLTLCIYGAVGKLFDCQIERMRWLMFSCVFSIWQLFFLSNRIRKKMMWKISIKIHIGLKSFRSKAHQIVHATWILQSPVHSSNRRSTNVIQCCELFFPRPSSNCGRKWVEWAYNRLWDDKLLVFDKKVRNFSFFLAGWRCHFQSKSFAMRLLLTKLRQIQCQFNTHLYLCTIDMCVCVWYFGHHIN